MMALSSVAPFKSVLQSVCHVGTRLTGSRSVACITSETLSGSDDDDDLILSLTEMVCLSCCYHVIVKMKTLLRAAANS